MCDEVLQLCDLFRTVDRRSEATLSTYASGSGATFKRLRKCDNEDESFGACVSDAGGFDATDRPLDGATALGLAPYAVVRLRGGA